MRTIIGDLGWAIAQHERLMAHWHAVLPLPMMEVALEDWVHDFSGTLARVLNFLGLEHDPGLRTISRTATHRQDGQCVAGAAADQCTWSWALV